ncbi:hypothetical protein OG225_38395 [Nocardia sp. NBC_01377]|uniref:DUF6545 domain-containing protein n=1 Tax=Nocardia sp. NBC_01377 TaxID=2903595 RepID=UPI003245370A
MTGVPVLPVLVITAFAIVVTILRLFFVRDSAVDRLINRALGLAGAGMLIALATTWSAVPVVVGHLGAITGFFTASAIYGAARMFDAGSGQGAYRRQRRYDLVALCGSASTVLVNLAVVLHLIPVELSSRWHSICSATSGLPLAVSGFLLMRASLREVRSADTPMVERVAYGALICVGVFWSCYSVALVVLYGMGVRPDDPGKGLALAGFTSLAVITTLLAIPLARMAAVGLGWDRDSRDCRRLRPLWSALTAAVPHVALTPDDTPREPAERRYRMAIEIRDALLHLRRQADGDHDDDIGRRALVILGGAQLGLPARSSADSHDVELRHLLALADRWPEAELAYIATDRSGLSAVPGNR